MRRSYAKFIESNDMEAFELVRRILNDAVQQSSTIEKIYLVNLEYEQVISSGDNSQIPQVGQDDLLASILDSKHTSALHIANSGQDPSIVFSAPIFIENTELGKVLMKVSIIELNELLRDHTGLGKTGEVILTTDNEVGELLLFTPLRFENFPQTHSPSSNLAQTLNQSLRDNADQLRKTIDYRDKEVFVVTRYLPELDIEIVVKMDVDEVLSINDSLKDLIVYLIGFLLIVVIVASLFLAHKITRPVIDITDVAVMISRGNFEKRIDSYSDDELGRLAKALNTMADRLIDTNLMLEERVHSKTAALQEANRKLERIAQTDGLTGLKNRRFFDLQMESEWRRNMREGKSISLLLIDIDYFKSINDKFGHQEGDRYIKAVARGLKKRVNRAEDIVARYGGEEFIVAVFGMDQEESLSFANVIREDVLGLRLESADSRASCYMSVSLGIHNGIPSRASNVASFIRLADEALYLAKDSGRNCVKSSVQLNET